MIKNREIEQYQDLFRDLQLEKTNIFRYMLKNMEYLIYIKAKYLITKKSKNVLFILYT